MADEAGPSGATKPVDAATLAEADAKFERGIQCIRSNDIEAAVALFSEVLEVRTRHYGELAPECASAYYRYGAALLYQAQDSGDVFGANVVKDGEEEEEEEAENKENGGDKGKAPAAPAEGVEAEEEGEDSGEAADNDLQLAWENLESAKVIWGKEGEEEHAQQLADVHGLLGEVAMESDDFETALAELDASLAHLLKFVKEDDRRIAELQYKRCSALQFGGHNEAALAAVQAACGCLAKRREALAAKLAAPAEGDDADKLKAESEDVAALLEDLQEKVTELQDQVAEDAAKTNMIRSTLMQLTAAAGGGPQQQAGSGGDTLQAAGGGGGGGVQNLGVVGRGTKRINLQPVQTNVPAAVGGGAAACAPVGAEPAAKKKRSLEDLMGGGGETTIGFGSAPAPAPAAAPAAAQPAAPSPVPAFLQAASVQAVYGGAAAEQE
ncbi:hypothetical protein CHLNCDRAFT_58502 [Chlorella variabilis]|uniref:Tetratricopeptide SHNi-TPR domain-containing protein n=1 Tax=Chlorella variabilis TaxID=554065 RepID=E1ZKN4_CHLVA|nr:hypothetical protein CHLNCDRAFT_58502 [Chlorella variabilis]EFN53411.1 hypothetical protein CHLNCDRAFT_58502 [Chlorella variabilis]|eukprot:XP_005845513.1 hypothetical protein CHLNCDRAFT_58502 [Chlorella variabilis]